MFWFSKKHHRLKRSKRPSRSLRYQYQEKEPKRSRHYDYDRSGPYLSNLPPELHLSIFDNLDPVSSACLGLTNKKFYPMHRSAHRKVGLYQGAEQPLHVLLDDWKPADMVLDWESEKLVSRERYEILQEVRRRERERRAYWMNASYNPAAHRATERERYERRYEGSRGEEERRKVRRRERLERHDIWTSGRRRN